MRASSDDELVVREHVAEHGSAVMTQAVYGHERIYGSDNVIDAA
jgi:hypothetical protein